MSHASPTDGPKTSIRGRLNSRSCGGLPQGRAHVVLVAEYSETQQSLCEYLENHGFQVSTVANRGALLRVLARSQVDLIVLDVLSPADGDGLALCREIRRKFLIPIFVLSARAEESERIRVFESGADAYLSKPFSRRELLGRINALLRRTQGKILGSSRNECATRFADWVLVSSSARTLQHRDGSVVRLSPKEFLLLVLLLNARGRVLSRSQLISGMGWHHLDEDARQLDVFVGRLRRKLRDGGHSQRLIRTVYAEGYVLACAPEQ
jgi:two-component system OmpR family response regulator